MGAEGFAGEVARVCCISDGVLQLALFSPNLARIVRKSASALHSLKWEEPVFATGGSLWSPR